MQPLSINIRRVYFFGFLALFLVCLPIALLFASGYRFDNQLGFVRTGGIFISVPYADATVLLNGREVGTSGILKRGFYLDGIAPGSYVMSVIREGSLPWYRTLVVEQEIVSDAHVLLIRNKIEAIPLSSKITTSTSTRTISLADHDAYRKAFSVLPATSTPGSGGEELFVEKGNVYVRLVDDASLPASKFCVRPSSCVREIPIEQGTQMATNAMYFGGAIVYVTKEGGVFLSEADVRPTPVSAPLYSRRNADARIIDGTLIIKDGAQFYEIERL